jgi:hypothetical protein
LSIGFKSSLRFLKYHLQIIAAAIPLIREYYQEDHGRMRLRILQFLNAFLAHFTGSDCRVRNETSFGRPYGTNATPWLKLKIKISFFRNGLLISLSWLCQMVQKSREAAGWIFKLRLLSYPLDTRPSINVQHDAVHTRQVRVRIAGKGKPVK